MHLLCKELKKKNNNLLYVDKIFIILTSLLILISCVNFFVKQMSDIAFYIFGIWSIYSLFYIIHNVGRITKIKITKKHAIIIIIGVIFCGIIYGYVINTRQYIYTWDRQVYYMKQMKLLNKFKTDYISAICNIIETTYEQDYGNFMLSFTSLIFSLVNNTPDNFVLTYYIVGIIPVIIIFSMIMIKLLVNIKQPRRQYIFMASGVLLLSTLPVLHRASIRGQPDIIGLIFLGLIILLTMDYYFLKIEKRRWLYLILCVVFLAITRRWYVFWLLGYFITYGLSIIVKFLLEKKIKELKIILKNTSIFILISIIFLGILVSPIIYRTLKNNYATSYSAWNIGGINHEFRTQTSRLGIIYVIIMICGVIYGLCSKENRLFTIQLLGTNIITIIAFTRIQNTGAHHTLMLIPTYIILFQLAIIGISKISRKIIYAILVTTTIFISIINFIGSITENKYIFNNRIFTNMSIKPTKRDDYENMGKMVEFIKKNCNIYNKAYINAATQEYSKHAFANYNLPEDLYLTNVIIYEASIDSVHGFPTELLNCKYVFISNIVLESTGAKKGNIIKNIKNAIEKNEIISSKYKKEKEFRMNEKIVFYAYRRVEKFDEDERIEWLKIFEEQSKKYPDLFEKKINSFKYNKEKRKY